MAKDVVIPAQLRAARALLDWTQDDLATAAGVGISSVREIEGLKRPADTGSAAALRRTLENEGIVFVPGDKDAGPGVRIGPNRPNIIRPPSTMSMWDGLPFAVEWQGRELTVFVSRDLLDDLDHYTDRVSDAAYVRTFEKFRGKILAGVVIASANPENFDRHGHLHLRGKDVPGLSA